ncbi:hypothetical protein ACVWYH_005446 [Bradyrhizobium sp. GM24.11]
MIYFNACNLRLWLCRVSVADQLAPMYAHDEGRLVLRGGLSTHKHVFKSELKSD